jgi:sec-independent protein translocase protein TatA
MFSGISPIQLLIVLVIVLAIFGTKKFRSMGSDLGGAVKGFRSAMSDAEKDPAKKDPAEKIGDQSEDADFDNTPVDEPSKSKNSED